MSIKTKRIICLMIGIASVLSIIGTVTYAYFTALGETTTQEASISTGTARATFRDGDTGITGELSFGESLTKKFTIENTGTVDANVKMYWKDLINTYIEGSLTYTLSQAESEEGPYTEVLSKTHVPKSERATTEILANNLTIPVGKTYYYNLEITLNYLADVNQDADIVANFSSSFDLKDINHKELSPSEKTLVALGQTSQGVRTDFDTAATTDEGIYEMEDDYGTSYYYRGVVEDNYVKYGVNAQNQEMWWRIIRINGDGSFRIIYDGVGATDSIAYTKGIVANSKWNAKDDDAKYVGWMYGPANTINGTTTPSTSKEEAQNNVVDSDIKKVVDAWYKENIEDTGYGKNVSDTIFCNDRSTPGKTITGWSNDTGLGYGNNYTAYGAYARFYNRGSSSINYNNPKPIFTCPQKNDAFTVSDTNKGNGALTYPVGLITADEIVAGGSGKYGTNNSISYSQYDLWSFSPSSFNINYSATVLNIRSHKLNNKQVNDGSQFIAPVINLTPEYVISMIGTGTITDPYRT